MICTPWNRPKGDRQPKAARRGGEAESKGPGQIEESPSRHHPARLLRGGADRVRPRPPLRATRDPVLRRGAVLFSRSQTLFGNARAERNSVSQGGGVGGGAGLGRGDTPAWGTGGRWRNSVSVAGGRAAARGSGSPRAAGRRSLAGGARSQSAPLTLGPRGKSGTGAGTTLSLEAGELIRRLLSHVLPPGLHKVRYFGWLHPNARRRFLKVQTLLAVPLRLTPHPLPEPPAHLRCPHCGKFTLQLVGRLPRARAP